MNPVTVVEMVIVEGNVAPKGSGISNQRAPIAVVVKNIGILVVGGSIEPVLQLVLQAGLHAVERRCISGNFGNRQQMCDARQVFPDVVGVCATTALAYRKMIGLIGDRIHE